MRPEDCQLFSGLPLTLDEFTREMRQGPAERFAACHMTEAMSDMDGRPWQVGRTAWTDEDIGSVWEAMHEPHRGDYWLLRGTLDEVASSAGTRRGVDVREGVSGDVFTRDVRSTGARVITLVAHWAGDQIEFRDGLWPVRLVAEAFAPGFDGTIDLTVCTSSLLHDAIRRRLGSTPRIIFNRSAAYLSLRIAAYRLAVRLLGELAPISYIDAYSEAWSRIRGTAGV